MKEYRVEGKAVNSDEWWSVGSYFDNIEEAKERVTQEIKIDSFYKKNQNKWEYRILVREVSNWEVYTEGI